MNYQRSDEAKSYVDVFRSCGFNPINFSKLQQPLLGGNDNEAGNEMAKKFVQDFRLNFSAKNLDRLNDFRTIFYDGVVLMLNLNNKI